METQRNNIRISRALSTLLNPSAYPHSFPQPYPLLFPHTYPHSLCTNIVLAAWQQRQYLSSNSTADKRQYRNNGNTQPYRQQRIGTVAANQKTGKERKIEHVHQVHAKRQLAKVCNQCRSLTLLNTRKQQKRTKRSQQHIRRTELPSPLNIRSSNQHTGIALQPETPSRKDCTHGKAGNTNPKTLTTVPLQMHTDIVSQHQIADIAREIPEQRKLIPETLTPQLCIHKTMEERNKRSKDKNTYKNTFFLRRGTLQPRRDNGNEQIQTQQRIHKP